MAVFTAFGGPLAHVADCAGVHVLPFFRGLKGLPGLRLHHCQQIAYVDIAVKLGGIRAGKCAQPCGLAQLAHPRDIATFKLQGPGVVGGIARKFILPGLDQAREYSGFRVLAQVLRVRSHQPYSTFSGNCRDSPTDRDPVR